MKFYTKKQLKNLPRSPGVYFLWSKKELLYIGYSKNLRTRIPQHCSTAQFSAPNLINPEELWRISIIETKDEYEAMKLEKELLKLVPTKNNNNWYKTQLRNAQDDPDVLRKYLEDDFDLGID